MASIIANSQRGSWQVQWHDGRQWRRVTIARRKMNWNPGDVLPKKPPREVVEALAIYSQREAAAKVNRKIDRDISVKDFLAAYQASYKADRSPMSYIQLGISVNRFLAFLKARRAVLVEQVTPALLDSYVSQLRETHAYRTVAKESGLLAGAWSKAVLLRQIAENPWKTVRVPGKPSAVNRSSWTREEFDRIHSAAADWLKPILVLGVQTGMRIGALIGLTWDCVDREEGAGKITVPMRLDKAGKGYSVPLSATARTLLDSLRQGNPKGHVLLDLQGQPIRQTQRVSKAVRAACKKAGVEQPDKPNHAMRRTFGRWAVLGELTGKDVPVYVVSRWMGHASVAMTETYLDLRDSQSAEWMAGK